MTKPIFIIRIPYETLTLELLDEVSKMDKKLNDYHVLSLMDSSIKNVEFECYNAMNCDNTDIETLKEYVTGTIKEIRSQDETRTGR